MFRGDKTPAATQPRVNCNRWSPSTRQCVRSTHSTSTLAFVVPASTTVCHETQEIVEWKSRCVREWKLIAFSSKIIVETHTKTPNVPFGDTFTVKQRFCLSSSGSNDARIFVSLSVIFERPLVWESRVEKVAVEMNRKLLIETIGKLKLLDSTDSTSIIPSHVVPPRPLFSFLPRLPPVFIHSRAFLLLFLRSTQRQLACAPNSIVLLLCFLFATAVLLLIKCYHKLSQAPFLETFGQPDILRDPSRLNTLLFEETVGAVGFSLNRVQVHLKNLEIMLENR